MLKKVTIKNCRGFEDEFSLDFSKQNYSYLTDMIIEEVVNPIFIYGDNSSGKTAILRSIYAVTSNLIMDLEDIILDTNSNIFKPEAPSEITLEFEYENKKFKYINVYNFASINKIEKEVLICDGQEIFNKTNLDTLYLRQDIKRESIAAYKYLSSVLFADDVMGINNISHSITKLIEEKNGEVNPIVDEIGQVPKLKITSEEKNGLEGLYFDYIDRPTNYNWNYSLFVSTGTQKLYAFLSIIRSLEPGSLVLIDEIDMHFNPKLLIQLSQIINIRKIQVIATSHSTYNLKSLRPDQVFETTNINNKLYVKRLCELNPKVRANQNLEKLYNEGYFSKNKDHNK